MENTTLLKEMRLFQGISTLDMVQINKRVRNRKFKLDEMVIEEGIQGHGAVYVVKSGAFACGMEKKVSYNPQVRGIPTQKAHVSARDRLPLRVRIQRAKARRNARLGVFKRDKLGRGCAGGSCR